jgi:hypothetical protein
VSTAVAETSSHVSSQSSRPKSGQGHQSSGNDGFSGMVDSNLNAAGNSDAPQPDRARSSQRDASSEPQANQRTGVRHRPQDQASPTRQTSAEATSRNSGATEDDATETPAITLEARRRQVPKPIMSRPPPIQTPTIRRRQAQRRRPPQPRPASLPSPCRCRSSLPARRRCR